MNNPLDLDAIKARAEDAARAEVGSDWTVSYDGDYYVRTGEGFPIAREMCEETAEFLAHAIVDVPALVAEVERLRTNNAELVALTQPILDRTEGQIGTHSDRCFEYHVACLAGLVQARLTVPSSLNSQEDSNG